MMQKCGLTLAVVFLIQVVSARSFAEVALEGELRAPDPNSAQAQPIDPRETLEFYENRKPPALAFALAKIAPRKAAVLVGEIYYDVYIKTYLERTKRSADFFPADMRSRFLEKVTTHYDGLSKAEQEVADHRALSVFFYKTLNQMRIEHEKKLLRAYKDQVAKGEATPIPEAARISAQKEIDEREVQVPIASSVPYLARDYMLYIGGAFLLVMLGLIAWISLRRK